MEKNKFSPDYYNGTEGKQLAKGKGAASPINEKTWADGFDLNEQLVKNGPATYCMRVNSSAMTGAGIFPGDMVLVDRSIEPVSGKIVIAILDGEMLIRELYIQRYKKSLLPATPSLAPIDLQDAFAYEIWGVVTYVIHSI